MSIKKFRMHGKRISIDRNACFFHSRHREPSKRAGRSRNKRKKTFIENSLYLALLLTPTYVNLGIEIKWLFF